MMFLGQDDPTYTYNHQYTRHFIGEACCGGRIVASIQEFICTENKTILQNLLKSDAQEICNLMQE